MTYTFQDSHYTQCNGKWVTAWRRGKIEGGQELPTAKVKQNQSTRGTAAVEFWPSGTTWCSQHCCFSCLFQDRSSGAYEKSLNFFWSVCAAFTKRGATTVWKRSISTHSAAPQTINLAQILNYFQLKGSPQWASNVEGSNVGKKLRQSKLQVNSDSQGAREQEGNACAHIRWLPVSSPLFFNNRSTSRSSRTE